MFEAKFAMCISLQLSILYSFYSDAYCTGYEALGDRLMNWTSASMEHADDADPLARISSIEELCVAQVEIRTDHEYWTALRLDNTGTLQWGHLPNNTANITTELLDKTQPANRCYAISRTTMKLLSKDCGSLHGVLTSNDGEQILTHSHQYFNTIHPFWPEGWGKGGGRKSTSDDFKLTLCM